MIRLEINNEGLYRFINEGLEGQRPSTTWFTREEAIEWLRTILKPAITGFPEDNAIGS